MIVANIMARLGLDTSGLDKGMNEAERKLSAGAGRMMKAGGILTAGLTLPILGAGIAVSKMAIDFESAFAGVIKTVDATDEQLKVMRQDIRDMAKEMPASAIELTSVAEAAGQLGIKSEAIVDFTRTMVMMGSSTNMTSEQAANDLARLSNVMGVATEDYGRLGSAVVDLGNKSAATETDIVSMSLRIAGAGKTVGLSTDQVLGWSAALASVGIESEMGGSAISRTFVTIANAAAKGGEDLEMFAAIAGMSAADYRAAFEQDASVATIAFIGGLKEIQEQGGNVFEVLDAVGLGEIRVRDTLLRSTAAHDLLTESLATGAAAWEEGSALSEEFARRQETSAAKLEVLKNRVVDIGITIGDALIPMLLIAMDAAQPFFDAIAWGAEQFAKLPKPLQLVIVGVLAFVAAIGPALLIAGAFASAIVTISMALAVPFVAGLLAVLGPIALVVAAIVAIEVVLHALGIDFKDQFNIIKAVVMAGVNFVIGYWKLLYDQFRNVIRLISAIIKGDWSAAWEAVKDIVWNQIKVIAALPRMAARMLFAAGEAIASSLGSGIKGTFVEVINWIIRQLNHLIEQANSISGKLPFGLGGKLDIGTINEIQLAAETTASLAANVDAATEAAGGLSETSEGLGVDMTALDDAMGGAGDAAGSAAQNINILEDGIISMEEAALKGFTAYEAGAIEAIDAIEKQQAEADSRAFDFAKTLGKVATAFEKSERAAQSMVLALAREALAKTQSALSAVFGRPSQEVAQLELQMALLNRQTLLASGVLNPQIAALEDQIERLQESAKGQVESLGDQISAIKDESGERKKSLQRQLEDARRIEATTDSEKAMKEQEIRRIEDRIRDLDDATDDQVKALERQKKAIEDRAAAEEKALEKQLDALNAQLESYDKQGEAIQHQIDLYLANAEILQKQAQAVDATLLTEAERQEKGMELIEMTRLQSEAVRDLTNKVGLDLIPELDEARDAQAILSETMRVLNDEVFRASLIPTVMGPDGVVVAFDAAAARAQLLEEAAAGAAGGLSEMTSALGDFETKLDMTATNVLNASAQAADRIKTLLNPSVIAPGAIVDAIASSTPSGITAGAAGIYAIQPEELVYGLAGNALGTSYWGGGPTWVGENGPEIVDLPQGARVYDSEESMGMRGGVKVYNYGPIYASDQDDAYRSMGDIAWALQSKGAIT